MDHTQTPKLKKLIGQHVRDAAAAAEAGVDLFASDTYNIKHGDKQFCKAQQPAQRGVNAKEKSKDSFSKDVKKVLSEK